MFDLLAAPALSKAFHAWTIQLQLSGSAEAVLRMLYLECRYNLAVLEALNFDHSATRGEHAFRAAAQHLQTVVMANIFSTAGESKKALSILKQEVELQLADGDAKGTSRIKHVSILSACVFVHVRVQALNSISNFARREVGRGVRQIRFKTRLLNVQAAIAQIANALEHHKAIKPLGSIQRLAEAE